MPGKWNKLLIAQLQNREKKFNWLIKQENFTKKLVWIIPDKGT